VGRQIIDRALSECEGAVKLHVERDNPARRLYERFGFTNTYLEMRYERPKG
jgi:ribosomal protein S18 acetylase RimI-like enzyme